MNAVPLAAQDADEAAKVMESRFVIAQLLASTGETESAIAELQAVRPLLAAAYGRSRRRSATSTSKPPAWGIRDQEPPEPAPGQPQTRCRKRPQPSLRHFHHPHRRICPLT